MHRFCLPIAFAFATACGDDGGGEASPPDARPSGYCDAQTPCPAGERDFCDIDGTYPASSGRPNTCIPDPATAECSPAKACINPDLPHCSSTGRCVACLNFSHCSNTAPLCSLSTFECGPCRQGNDGNNICGAIDPLQPFCGVSGSCVECLANADCSIATAPICDATLEMCRPCANDDDCAAGTCNQDTGACE